MWRFGPAVVAVAFAWTGSGCAHRQRGAATMHPLYIARHGQTEWNRIERFQGDPDLDPVGYLNRVSLWLLLRKTPLVRVYASEFRRTQRTAQLVAREHGLEVQVRSAVNEIAPGVLEGVCRADIEPGQQHSPEDLACVVPVRGSRPQIAAGVLAGYWRAVKQAGHAGRAPHGENFDDMVRRAAPFVRGELADTLTRGAALVVGHGLINSVLLHLVVGWPLHLVAGIMQQNDQVYRVEQPFTPRARVLLYTPGRGWAACAPPSAGQTRLDCDPGPSPRTLAVDPSDPSSR